MKIKIEKTTNPHYWYSNQVGMEYSVICYYPTDLVFLVRDSEGHLNIVHKNDCIVIKEQQDDQ